MKALMIVNTVLLAAILVSGWFWYARLTDPRQANRRMLEQMADINREGEAARAKFAEIEAQVRYQRDRELMGKDAADKRFSNSTNR